jgi:putative intracellular protease/amidase
MKTAIRFAAIMAAFVPAAHSAVPAARDPTEIRVGILMFDGVQIIDFAAPYEVFGQAGFTIDTVSADGKPITTTMGLKVVPDLAFAGAPKFDVLLIPGGHVQDVASSEAVLSWLRTQSSKADLTLSVCTGSHILAAGGLLKDLPATTFHTAFDQLAHISPSTKVVRDVRWVDNGKIITSAGLSSGIDAALHVVERLMGEARARTIAMTLEYNWDPTQGFVRGLMADRYINASVQWPEGSRFERLVSYGDRTQWIQRFRVSGKAAPAEYLDRIADKYGQLPGWSAQRVSEHELLLQGRPGDGAEVDVHVSLSQPADDGSFELSAQLQVTD